MQRRRLSTQLIHAYRIRNAEQFSVTIVVFEASRIRHTSMDFAIKKNISSLQSPSQQAHARSMAD